MIEMGIIDPLRVTRSALQNGASVAGLLLTTNTLVAEEQTPWGGSRGADDRVRPARRGPAPAVARLQHAAVARARPVGRLRPRRWPASRPRRPAPDAAGASRRLAQPSGLRLLRSRGRARGIVALLGPAFVAAVAYVDPGNFATNFTAGARFGYALAWVVVVANLMAMLVQYLSAKIGVATGRDLPRAVPGALRRARCPRACGCRRSSSRWPPTWPSSSGRRSG